MFKKQEQENVNNKLATQLGAFIFLLRSVNPCKTQFVSLSFLSHPPA